MNKEELNQNLLRYYFLLKTLDKVLNEIEKSLVESNQWFIFCHKIGLNFLTQAKTFVFNITQGLKIIIIDDISVSDKLDISALYTNIRLQTDTYSTFHHIFMHNGSWEEKIIRFNLWKMDALLSRQNFSDKSLNAKQIDEEREEIERIENMISDFEFYKNLSNNQRKNLIRTNNKGQKFANWKFDLELITRNKDKYSWEELTLNTGIKPSLYNDLHNYSSMHAHSNYISVIQNDQLKSNDENYAMRITTLLYACYLISFFLDDLCKSFNSGKKIAENLNEIEIEVIKSFLKTGRKEEHIKYFK